MTLTEAKQGLEAKGFTLNNWSIAHGFNPQTVRNVILAGASPRQPVGKRILEALEATLTSDGKMPHETGRAE